MRRDREIVGRTQIAVADQRADALAAPHADVLAIERARAEQPGFFVDRDAPGDESREGHEGRILQVAGRVEKRPRDDGRAGRTGGETGRDVAKAEEIRLQPPAARGIEPVAGGDAAARAPAVIDAGIAEQHRRGGQAEHTGLGERRAGRAGGDQRRQMVALDAPGQYIGFDPERVEVGGPDGRLQRQVGRGSRCHGKQQGGNQAASAVQPGLVPAHATAWNMGVADAQDERRNVHNGESRIALRCYRNAPPSRLDCSSDVSSGKLMCGEGMREGICPGNRAC